MITCIQYVLVQKYPFKLYDESLQGKKLWMHCALLCKYTKKQSVLVAVMNPLLDWSGSKIYFL